MNVYYLFFKAALNFAWSFLRITTLRGKQFKIMMLANNVVFRKTYKLAFFMKRVLILCIHEFV
jgi:hypothetical protein